MARLDGRAWAGVNRLIDSYLVPGEHDEVVVVYTSETYEVACWLSVALERRNIKSHRVWMIPLQDPEFPARLSATLPDPRQLRGNLLIVTLELETLSHDEVFRALMESYSPDTVRIYRAISASRLLFSEGLRVTPTELSERNVALLERLMPARRIRVTSASGTDLRVSFDSCKYRWISNRGVWRPGKFVILPAGEVATFPRAIEGVFVADFAFNTNFITRRDARLDRTPVRVWVEDGRAVRYECSDATVQAFLADCFKSACARQVGEIGFGTNFGVRAPVPLNSHINERHPGLHLGFGQSNQSPALVGYECPIHLDLISTGGEIAFADGSSPLNLSSIEPSRAPHPTQTRDEDARSADGKDSFDSDDCCGMTAG